MRRFTSTGRSKKEGRELVRARSNGEEEEPLALSFQVVAGARTFSRRQALGLLGGSLAGASLLSFGLAAPVKAAGAAIVGPSGTDPELSFAKAGHWWNLTLKWTCIFPADVVNHKFGTNWTLMEWDPPYSTSSPSDVVSATVEPHPHSATSATKTFIPSQANPSNPKAVSFTQTIGWHQDDLDTELGAEELYAIVRLRDLTLMTPSIANESEKLGVSP